ncbi:MAG: hypothetical protein A4E53_00167 [Pelotomaculum sp. PtaB.Bin104]|nr:MAG: hypothetical protein A4E53_00167 [Pelotomaculum sp. PtaB.Bin104]
MGNITVWDTFFMMLTVIPVSKMFNMIFMKMLVRVGTVNQEKWSAIGLGALGATYSLMKNGGVPGITGNMARMQVKPGPPSTPGLGGPSGAAPNIPGAGPGGGAGSSGANSYSGNVASDISGYRETPSGFFIPSGVYDDAGYGNENTSSGTEEGAAGVSASGNVYGAGAGGPGAVPERGSRRLEDIVNIASQAGHKFSKGAAFAGVLSSFAVPEAAPAMAGVYGVAGKASAGLASTAYHVSQEIRERKNNGQDFWGAMKDLTGTTNRVAATTKVAATMALSPMGRRVSNFGTQTSVNAYLWTKGRFGKN